MATYFYQPADGSTRGGTYLTLEDVADLDEHAEVGVEDPDAVGEDVVLVEVGDLALVDDALLRHLQAAAHRGQPAADQGEHLALHQGSLTETRGESLY